MKIVEDNDNSQHELFTNIDLQDAVVNDALLKMAETEKGIFKKRSSKDPTMVLSNKGRNIKKAMTILLRNGGTPPFLEYHPTIESKVGRKKDGSGNFNRQEVPVNTDGYIKIFGGSSTLSAAIKGLNASISVHWPQDSIKLSHNPGGYGKQITFRINGKEVNGIKQGNQKPIPKWIAIFNTSPAIDCSSRYCGQCEFSIDCYALGNEANSKNMHKPIASIGGTTNAKRKQGAMLRKMMHEDMFFVSEQDALFNKIYGTSQFSDERIFRPDWLQGFGGGKTFVKEVMRVSHINEGPESPDSIRFIRWNEAGDVADEYELLWVAKAAALLYQESNGFIRTTIYTHRADIFQRYQNLLQQEMDAQRISQEEYDNIQAGLTIMGSGFMGTNEFRAVHAFSTANGVDRDGNLLDPRYTIGDDGEIYSTSLDEHGKPIYEYDDNGNVLLDENGNKVKKQFIVYHCSSNCELCFAQWGIGLCYAPDLQNAIVEEKIRHNPKHIRNEIMRMNDDAGNWNHYVDSFGTIKKFRKQQQDILNTQLDNILDTHGITDKKDRREARELFEIYGQSDFLNEFNYQQALAPMEDFLNNYGEKLTSRDLAYLYHYLVQYEQDNTLTLARDVGLRDGEWIRQLYAHDNLYGNDKYWDGDFNLKMVQEKLKSILQ